MISTWEKCLSDWFNNDPISISILRDFMKDWIDTNENMNLLILYGVNRSGKTRLANVFEMLRVKYGFSTRVRKILDRGDLKEEDLDKKIIYITHTIDYKCNITSLRFTTRIVNEDLLLFEKLQKELYLIDDWIKS